MSCAPHFVDTPEGRVWFNPALSPATRQWLADQERERWAAPVAETVILADGEALQGLIPGVEPVSLATRQIAAAQASRAARRGNAPLPAGSLFDEVARDQGDLFG